MSLGLTIENTAPGVVALINSGQVSRPIQRQPSSTAFAVGYTPWGPVNIATVITSWAEFARTFGGFNVNSYLDDFAYIFFNHFGGKQLVVSRVVGANAANATVTLIKDAGGQNPIDTIIVDAKYPSTTVDITISVQAGTISQSRKLTISSVLLGRTEVFDNFRNDATSIAALNEKSELVKLTFQNNGLPDITDSVLASGDDDFAGLSASDYIGTDNGTTKTGLQVFKDENLGTGQVAIPGITTDATHAALIAHAEAYNRLAFIDLPLGSSKTTAATKRALYGTWYGAIYFPWVEMRDVAGSGSKKFYPPSCFAAGACAKVDRKEGTHKAPANLTIPGALDVERASNGQPQVDEGVLDYLTSKDVNVIMPIANEGVKIYGARVMTADRRVSFVHEIRLLNLFYYSAKRAYSWAVFAVVDGTGRLFRDLVSSGKGFLRGFWNAGALYGKTEEEAFNVVADDSNNPPNELANGKVHVQWAVKISPTAEQIIVNIDNVSLSQDLSVLNQ